VRTVVLLRSWSKRIHRHAFYSSLNTWWNRFRNCSGAYSETCSWACARACFWSIRLVLYQIGFSRLRPVWFRPCPLSIETAPGPDPSSGYLPSSCVSNKFFLARPSLKSSSYASISTTELVSSKSTCTLSSTQKFLLLNTFVCLTAWGVTKKDCLIAPWIKLSQCILPIIMHITFTTKYS